MTEYKVFYSWQSDLPNATNRVLIETALKNAIEQISADQSVGISPVMDRDTAGVPGSPDLQIIFSKIDQSRAFVCDVSIINGEQQATGKGRERPTPNPNVLIELGYASKSLGNDKIIMVMNTAFGTPELLPADIRSRIVTTYNMPNNTDGHTTSQRELEAELRDKLRLIFDRPELLHEVHFNYRDSPIQYGWDINPDPGANQPTFTPISDGYVGNAIQILPHGKYDMNRIVPVLDHVPTTLEFVADYGTTSLIYAGVKMAPRDCYKEEDNKEGWIPILEGFGPAQPVVDENREWEIFRRPVERLGAWKVFRLDLNEVFNETFGTKGWIYKGLHGFRVRGRIALARISLLR